MLFRNRCGHSLPRGRKNVGVAQPQEVSTPKLPLVAQCRTSRIPRSLGPSPRRRESLSILGDCIRTRAGKVAFSSRTSEIQQQTASACGRAWGIGRMVRRGAGEARRAGPRRNRLVSVVASWRRTNVHRVMSMPLLRRRHAQAVRRPELRTVPATHQNHLLRASPLP